MRIGTGFWILILLLSWPAELAGQRKHLMSRQEYINTYSDLAMREMARVGIPASIILAQACLESDNGNSSLAKNGNNHFGIKCHDWTGRTIYHDDDRKKECFRSYDSPYQSFIDHSEFLLDKPRYSPLFDLQLHDYRGWAKGLKKAGYATSPDYAKLLIQIIEDNQLYQYDLLVLEGGVGTGIDTSRMLTGTGSVPGTSSVPGTGSVPGTSNVPGTGNVPGREVMLNNRIEYIITQPGDTPESIRREMDLYANEIYRYNNLYKGEKLKPGQIVYLQPKRGKAARGNEIHRVDEGETMYDISQTYGVRLKNLYKMNRMEEGAQPLPGSDIYLRRRRPEPVERPERVPEPEWDEGMRFEFTY